MDKPEVGQSKMLKIINYESGNGKILLSFPAN